MQTRTYGDLFKITSALIGTGGQLDVTEQDQLSHFINRRFQQAFDESPVWPRYVVAGEPRRIASLAIEGAGGTSAADVNGIYYLLGSVTGTGVESGSDLYYKSDSYESQSLINGTIIYRNATPAWVVSRSATVTKNADGTFTVSSTGTAALTELDLDKKANPANVEVWSLGTNISTAPAPIFKVQFIPYTEPRTNSEDVGKNNIGDFNKIHKTQPFLNNSALEYEFFVDEDGAHILNLKSTDTRNAFVTYKKEFTPFTVTSDYYNSTVEVPGEFFNYIAHAVYADFLRVQNRQEQALAEEQVAQTYLALELEKIDIRSNNNTINKRFSTYVNRQSR